MRERGWECEEEALIWLHLVEWDPSTFLSGAVPGWAMELEVPALY